MRRTPVAEGRRAALRRLRRAHLTEARRIRRAVADGYRLTPAHLRAPCRAHPVIEARQIAMYLMRTDLRWPTLTRSIPFPAARIGQFLGGRDHSTVIHDIAVIAARLATDTALRALVTDLRIRLDRTYEDPDARRRAA
jgi:chromosomal replication initiator protein